MFICYIYMYLGVAMQQSIKAAYTHHRTIDHAATSLASTCHDLLIWSAAPDLHSLLDRQRLRALAHQVHQTAIRTGRRGSRIAKEQHALIARDTRQPRVHTGCITMVS